MKTHAITQEEVTQALYYLHPNKDDWTPFERSNMERALYKFWVSRIAGPSPKKK